MSGPLSFILLFFLHTLSPSTYSGGIAGTVTKSGTSTAIAGVSVKISQSGTLITTVTTNSSGSYSATGLAAGTYDVQASVAGYESKTVTGNSVTDGSTTTVNISLSVPVNYVYDNLGRLTGVTDQSGNAATYSYDAVGNLLAIGRQTASQVSITDFSPGSGVVGASVIIYGTGFSETASQNSVTFNGTTATVTSSSLTQMVTSVPSGATTGNLAITTPLGSITSSSGFTVTSGGSDAPTITSFTPTIGTVGTSVTISGTNFETLTTNNRTSFNISDSLVSSASATSISTTVPTSASGRITVATPNGSVTSSADFFVPPSPYTASSVNYTGRMTIGSSSTVTISTASKIGLVLFDAIAGQRVGVTLGSGTIAAYNVAVYNPNGSFLYASTVYGSSGGFFDTSSMSAAGTYVILIAPTSTYTGNVPITLSNVTDMSDTLTAGTPVTKSTTTVGQNVSLTFWGTAAQRKSLNITSASCVGTVWVSRPGGANLASKVFNGASTAFFEPMTLPITGTHKIYTDFNNTCTGSATYTLYDLPADLSGTITMASPFTATFTTPGQNGSYTFSGTSGNKLTMNLSSVTVTGFTVTIKKPDGTTLVSTAVGVGGWLMELQSLPATGTYTLLIDPSSAYTGNVTVGLYDVVDVTGSFTIGDPATSVTINTPSQRGLYTFSGTASQQATVHITSNTINGVYVRILKPDGTQLYQQYSTASSFNLTTQTLPTTGTYTLVIDPDAAKTGSLNFSVSSP